jgi:signal transduction histidine kinase
VSQPPSASTRRSSQRLATALAAGRRWVVLGMLLSLHAAMISDQGMVLQRLMLLSHFGFFLVWQPFFAAERELKVFSVVLLVAITSATLYFLPGWLIVTWMLLLLGILGGRVFMTQSGERNRFYLIAFMYVLTLLLLWVEPAMLMGESVVPPVVAHFARDFLPLVLLLLVFMPRPREEHVAQVFDFFYALLVFQLCVVIVLGIIVVMRFTGESYMNSVLITLSGASTALFVFAALWNPMRGFGGLRTYFSVYLMSVGLPFEMWMRRVAELAEIETDPRRFLELSLNEISTFPWMRGGRWKSPDGEGRFGEETEYVSRYAYESLEIAFFTKMLLSPALLLHMRLLSQVVGEFYEGKRRESMLRRNAYLQAVHETGARLTHDVKNLLQSLYTLTSMAPKGEEDAYAALLQRQLPQLTKRLQGTLDKLRSPEAPVADLPVSARAWWAELEKRLRGSGVRLEAAISTDGNIPAALFDSFVENALDNARAKRAREGELQITIRFTVAAELSELSVVDTGSAVPASIAQRLFREPVERVSGMGIGLYHLSRLAQSAGYRVDLTRNTDGDVCFSLFRGTGDFASAGER